MTTKADIWMPLYVGDYLADTSRLSTIQHGAYLLLMLDYWRAGPPPDDDQVLAQITRMTPDAWSIARAVLASFFRIENGQWRHKRIDAEMDKARTQKERNTARAEKAAAARWHAPRNATSIAPSTPREQLEQCPSPSPSESPKGDGAPRLSSPGREVLSIWNEVAKPAKLPTVGDKVISERAKAIRARLAEHGLDVIAAALRTIPQSAFLMGSNDRGWRANLDDMMRPRNMQKLIDGGYHAKGELAAADKVDPAERRASLERTRDLYLRIGRADDAAEVSRQIEAMA